MFASCHLSKWGLNISERYSLVSNLNGEINYQLSEWIVGRTGAQTMLCLTYSMIRSVTLAPYGVSHA